MTNDFSKYDDDVLEFVRARLEEGVSNALVTIGQGSPRSGYAVNSYEISMAMLAGVEEEIWRRKNNGAV